MQLLLIENFSPGLVYRADRATEKSHLKNNQKRKKKNFFSQIPHHDNLHGDLIRGKEKEMYLEYVAKTLKLDLVRGLPNFSFC